VERLRAASPADVHALRDPTRGGVASALNELATASGVGVEVDEGSLLVPDDVRAACEVLGLDPLYVANEGILVGFVAPAAAAAALAALQAHPLGREARVIGRATVDHPRLVVLRTRLGGSRVVDLLPGDQLPRIC
jgi:hydrogenase expression/formation protein HypE